MDKSTDDTAQTQTPVTDDQELANVLAGMNQQATQTTDSAAADDASLQFEETPAPGTAAADPAEPAAQTTEPDAEAPAEELSLPPMPPIETPAAAPASHDTPAAVSPELDSIKKTALEELRPLVDRLELPADEKFDTLLLIIRSTDDQSLVGAAHDAAKAIEDDTKRAQALLDVIKEIDYFSGQGSNPAA